jgi:hypothetical protein
VPFEDDTTIPPDERLLRRVHPTHVVPDQNGGFRLSSAAFNDRELSVDIASTLSQLNRPYESCLHGYDGYGLIWFSAQSARANQQVVCRDPLPDNPAHGIVYGHKPTSVRRRLAALSTWLVRITPGEGEA